MTLHNTVREPLVLEFADNRLLPALFGEHGAHLARIEARLAVSLIDRGNQVFVSGAAENCARAERVLKNLYQKLSNGEQLSSGDVDGAVRFARADESHADDARATPQDMPIFHTPRRAVRPRSPTQARYMDALQRCELVVGSGPAGTGKTYLAVAAAALALTQGKVERLILSRPAVEAGENLGFLPGDMRDKVDPYLRPLYDALYDMLPPTQVARGLESGEIEIAPLAFMRGRSLSRAYIILDEAQNATDKQMKMFLTRMGENSKISVTGDPSQIDLPRGAKSGLTDALQILAGMRGVEIIRFAPEDVVRHDLVARIVKAYNKRDKNVHKTEKSSNVKG